MPTEQMKESILLANKKAKEELMRKYPDATMSKFRFTTTLDHDGAIGKTSTYFLRSDGKLIDIDTKNFRESTNMWCWLHVNADKFKLDSLDDNRKKDVVFYERQLKTYNKDILPIILVILGVVSAGYFLMYSEKRKRKKSKKNRWR